MFNPLIITEMKSLKKLTVFAFAAIFSLAACKKDETAALMQDNPGNQPQAQTFNVKMTDGPGDYEGLNIKIVSVDAYLDGKGWVNLDAQEKTVNVLSLTNGTDMSIAAKRNAEVGAYTKLKITIDADAQLKLNAFAMAEADPATIISANEVKLGWDGSREIEIVIDEHVTTQAGAEVLIDFDVANSVKLFAGKYIIKPVIRQIKDARTGVQGRVEGSADAAITVTNGSATFTTYIDAQGRFMLRGINPGTYKVLIQRAKKETDAIKPAPKEIDGVVIVDGEIKQMGQIAL
jgi:hypothetical protein